MSQSSIRKNLVHWFSNLNTWIFVAAGVILSAIFVYAYLGLFARFQADDYCMAWNAQRPFLDSIIHWYKNDSSRYAATALFTMIEKISHGPMPILTGLMLILWLAGTFYLFHNLQRTIKLDIPPIASFLLAGLLVFYVPLFSPNRYQILFWRPALVTYTIPLALLTFLCTLLLIQSKNPDRKWRPLVATLVVILFFLNGGFSETMASLQIGGLGLALVVIFFLAKRDSRNWTLLLVGSALLGSLLAMATLYFSPATAMRQGLIGPPPDLFNLIKMSFTYSFQFMYISLKDFAFHFVIIMLTSMLLAYCLFYKAGRGAGLRPGSLVTVIFSLPLFVYLVMVCICAPSAFGESSSPESRVLVTAFTFMVALVIMEGFIFGICLGLLHQLSSELPPTGLRVFSILFLVVLSLYPLYSTRKLLKDLPDYQKRAIAWDGRDAQIRSLAGQGQLEISVTAFDSIASLMELGPESTMWVNSCAAYYYGVQSISAELP